MPDALAEEVQPGIAVGGKKIAPVFDPLLVEMMDSSLSGDGGGEEDEVGGLGKLGDKWLCALWGEVLGHLEGNGEIESSAQVVWLCQILLVKICGWNLEKGGGFHAAVDAKEGGCAPLLENGEPGSDPAAGIDRGIDAGEQFLHEGENRLRGVDRVLVLLAEMMLGVSDSRVFHAGPRICREGEKNDSTFRGIAFLRTAAAPGRGG